MNLTPLQQRIIDILADGSWHCLASEEYQKDDRARISELRHKGFKFDESGKICDWHNHGSKLKLRRLISFPDGFVDQTMQPDPKTMQPFTTAYTIGEYCCGDRVKGLKSHSNDCRLLNEKKINKIVDLFGAKGYSS